MLADSLKSKFPKKGHKAFLYEKGLKPTKELFPNGGGPQDDLLYGFLCLVYDGVHEVLELEQKMKKLFISTMRQNTITSKDVKEFVRIALVKKFIILNSKNEIVLSKKGKIFVESCYVEIQHESYWMGKFLTEKAVLGLTAFFLIILSISKIIIGIHLNSRGMMNDGFENLTDLIKVAIILVIGINLKKDRLASIIIISMMLFTGITLILSSIETILFPSVIVPTVQGYILVLVSILMNLSLMFLKGLVGKSSGNLALISDSKDSKLNMLISGGVMIGLTFAIFKIYFIDSIIAIIIAIIISKEGIELLIEIIKKKDELDITSIKLFSDTLYSSRLSGYLLGNIKDDHPTRQGLILQFEEGVNLGRIYYCGFADFFYDKLGSEIANIYLEKLLKNNVIKEYDEKLYLTNKGEESLKKLKKLEYNTHERYHNKETSINKRSVIIPLICISFLIILIIFGPPIINAINNWMASI